jgi:hypothetical protein
MYKQIVLAKYPDAELRSDGWFYYIFVPSKATILGGKSSYPDYVWRSAARHVRCM